LKKPSAARPQKPLDGWTFLVEESLGKRTGFALREAGISVVIHGEAPSDSADHVALGLGDEEWMVLAAKHRWVCLSKDTDQRYKPLERAAIVKGKLQVFHLTRGSWTHEQQIAAFLAAQWRMRRLLKKQPPPFIQRINKAGEFTQLFTEAELTRTGPPRPG
jgi:hypothetical protein